jgi:hypothetical protein
MVSSHLIADIEDMAGRFAWALGKEHNSIQGVNSTQGEKKRKQHGEADKERATYNEEEGGLGPLHTVRNPAFQS